MLDKKTHILDCALAVCKSKPVALVTMKDIIREASISQGGIYRYYKDLDDVFVALLNRFFEQRDNKYKLDRIFEVKDSPQKVVFLLCKLMNNNLQFEMENYNRVVYEIRNMYLREKIRYNHIKSQLHEDLDYGYLCEKLGEFIDENVSKGRFTPLLEPNLVLAFIASSYDGIYSRLMLEYKTKSAKYMAVTTTDLLTTLFETMNIYLKIK